MNLSSPFRQDQASGILSLRILHSKASRKISLRYIGSRGLAWILAPTEPFPAWATILTLDRPLLYWRIDGQGYLGRARPIKDSSELSALRRNFEAVYGMKQVRAWFGSAHHGFVLEPAATDRTDYATLVEKYFDALSDTYDSVVRGNAFDMRLREVTGPILAKAFDPGEVVLEIGAGTGLETLPLARRGVQVVATDISRLMLDKLAKKAKEEGLSDLVMTRRLSASDLSPLHQEFGSSSFDGAFSNFGALNCEADIGNIPAGIAQLVREHSLVVFAVWNRVCLWEMIAYIMAGKPRRGLARLRDPVPVGDSRFGVPVFAQSFSKFVRRFSPFFRLERTLGLPVFLPPYDLGPRIERLHDLVLLLESIEGRLAGHAPFNRLGDHFVVELRRLETSHA